RRKPETIAGIVNGRSISSQAPLEMFLEAIEGKSIDELHEIDKHLIPSELGWMGIVHIAKKKIEWIISQILEAGQANPEGGLGSLNYLCQKYFIHIQSN